MAVPVVTPDPIEGEIVEDIVLTKDLTVRMRLPTEDQAVVVVKALKAAQRAPEAGPAAIDIVFRVITKMLVDPQDVDRIDTALIDGDLKVRTLAHKALRYEDEDDKPATNRRARRAR
jgi:hypothetical protein